MSAGEEHRDRGRLAELLTTYALEAGLLYLMLHPSKLEELTDRAGEIRQGIVHRFSAWQPLQAIRSLPETGDGAG
jgi:hypothetical protein